ncbi:hypothetical protein DUNSADRAFT_18099 [Dunaliella salina]|uniref:Uncharacterized protein n=1 Tax=Dunaliella salina TaxID=3046 RepID=A0ABQ7G0P3_DUNSA|nr:hypothetical protein DUNSADRAFT_18099 [Dunaliella salina]|eukprot:KAF5828173.1 hypothetical protein DUNSADRAFT_18099 [Dunaliella salina]
MKLCIAVALLALLASPALSQYGDDYDGYNYEDAYGGGIYDDYGYGGYDDGYGGYAGGEGGVMDYDDLYNDDYGYYQDADKEYYEYYGYYADDDFGYGDDYYYEDADTDDCSIDPVKNTPVLPENSVPCDIKIKVKQGGSIAADIDGIYKLESCYNNKPLYRRKNSPPGQERALWYSSTFGDWDLSKGSEPNEADVLMYGGEMEHVSAPVFVTNWHVQDLSNEADMDAFMASNADVTCADGKTPKEDPNPMTPKVTGLSPEEMEAKYMQIYSNMKRTDPSPEVNFTFVVLIVVVGLTIVLAIPYFLLQRRVGGAGGGKKGAGGGSFITSFAEVLQRNRKLQGGHVN